MRYAILGGSFNPPHLGHLCLAEAALLAFGYDRIILIPAFISPFKAGSPGPSAADRLDMLAAAIPGEGRFAIDDVEIRREGVSYTIDTIEYIEKMYRPQGRLGLILGDDLAEGFPQWKRAAELAERTDIIIARRTAPLPVPFPYPFRALDNAVLPVSSCMIRERIEKGQSWRYMVPQAVRFLIQDRGLYGCKPPVSSRTQAEAVTTAMTGAVEDAARSMLNPSRFFHSRNTALLCHDLSVRFGLDPLAGYLAGIGHDICKSMDDAEMTELAASDGLGLSALERQKPSILHGRAAAVLLSGRFGIHNTDILEAVRLHTTGGSGMGSLAKILYVADKTEPSREGVQESIRRALEEADLDTLFALVLDETVAYLRSRKLDISSGTLRLLEVMHKRRDL